MTLTATADVNGKPGRKQLSDQLDRLDGLIDALADALPQAVADATREGARQAVRDVLVELMTNPDLRALMAGGTPPPAPPSPPPGTTTTPSRPGVWAKLKGKLATATDAVAARCRTAVAAARVMTTVLPPRRPLLVAVGVGAIVAVAAYAGPPAVAAILSGVGGAGTAVAVQVGHWFRRPSGRAAFAGAG